jgi:hypothetical protein
MAYWIAQLSTGSYQAAGKDAAVDSSGNLYVTGLTENSTNKNILLAKVSDGGSLTYQKYLGIYGQKNSPGGIALDSTGAPYLVGTIGTNYDLLLTKYSALGSQQWGRKISGDGGGGYDIAFDGSDNIYVVGQNGSIGSYDGLIAKYNSSGTLQWQRTLGYASTLDAINAIAVTSTGAIYIAGSNTNGGFVAKYNTSGTIQWQREIVDAYGCELDGIALDSSENAYAVGYTDLGNLTPRLILAKYNSSGTLQWQKKISSSGSSDVEGHCIAVDSSGNSYVGGAAVGNMLLAKFNSSGTQSWQRTITYDSVGSEALGICLNSDASILYVAGDCNSKYINIFAKLPVDGSLTGSYTLDGNTVTYATSSYTVATSTLTEQAATMTDAASSLTNGTVYPNDGTDSATYKEVTIGATTHATSGALTGQASAVVGTAKHNVKHPTSGALSGSGTTIVGVAVHLGKHHYTTGTLTGQGSLLAGVAHHASKHVTSGVISGGNAIVVGTAHRATRVVHTCIGALSGVGSLIVGSTFNRWSVTVIQNDASELIFEASGLTSPTTKHSGTIFNPTDYRSTVLPYRYLPIIAITYNLAQGLVADLQWSSSAGAVPIATFFGQGSVNAKGIEAFEDCGPLSLLFSWPAGHAADYAFLIDITVKKDV